MVVVTAQFAPTDSRETVNSVRIISEKDIGQKAATNLLELLQTEVNLRISHDPVLGSALVINGLQSENLKILIDGVPVIGRLGGNIDIGQLPAQSVRKVEIIEGAQSLLYGSDASAGVVNLLTKVSQLHRFEGEASGLTESNGFRSLNARAGADIGKIFLSINGGLLHFEPDGDTTRSQLWNPKEQQNARALLSFSPNEKLTLRFSGSHFSEEVKSLGEVRRPLFKPYAIDDYYHTARTDFHLHGEGWLPGQLYFQAIAAHNRFDRKKNTYRLDLEPDTTSLVPGQQDTSAATGLLFRVTVASDQKSRRWDFLAGLENYRETAEGARIVDTTAGRRGFASVNNLGIFGSLKYRLAKQLTLQGGARFTHHSQFGTALSPSLWLAFRPNGGWEIKASYANGFRSPGLKELYFEFIDINHYIVGNGDLKPERSHNFRLEAGREKLFKNDWSLSLGANGFYNKVNDRIVLAEYETLRFTYQNLAGWRTAGGGLTASVKKWRRLKFSSSFVLTGFFNSLSETENVETLSWSPEWANDLALEFLEGKMSVRVWHKWTGDTPYFFTENGEVKAGNRKGWHLLNASVQGHFFDKKIQLITGVKNLLDTRQTRTGGTDDSAHSGSDDGLRPVHWGRSFFVQARFFIHSKK
ncbi:MAG: hypothetical protein Kow0027_05990 [Saprospiraceae bacterium]